MEKDFYKIIAIALLSCVVYSNIHSGPFLHDDVPAILNNPDVQETRPWPNLWFNDFWGTPMNHKTSHKSYRPIIVVFFRLLHTLWGNWSTPYHICNILFHAIASVLFFLVCKKIAFGSRNAMFSFINALLFVMHPIHTEAVCGIVGLAEILSACCFMLAILTYAYGLDTKSTLEQSAVRSLEPIECIRSTESDSESTPVKIDTELRKRKNVENTSELSSNSNDTILPETAVTMEYLTTFSHDLKMLLCPFLLAAMSMLCKESGVTVMAIFVVYELVKKKSQLKASEVDFTNLLDVRLISRIVCIAIWLVVLLVFRMWMMEWRQPGFAKGQNPAAWTEEKMTRILTHLYLCWFNFRLLLYPVNLSYDYFGNSIPLITTIWDLRNVSTFVFFILCIGGGIVCLYCLFNKADWANTFLMGYALLVVPFIPASNLFFPVGFVVAERVLYTPSCGFIILVVLAGQKFYETFPLKRTIVYIATIAIMVFYFLQTYNQNFNWTSRENFAKAGVQAHPENSNMHYNWGIVLLGEKRYEEASFEFEEVIRLDPMNYKACNNLAGIWEKLKKPLKEIEKLYLKSLEIGPKEDVSFGNLANILLKQNRPEEAFELMDQALAIVDGPLAHLTKVARMANNYYHTSRSKNLYFNLMKKNCLQSKETNSCLEGCLPAMEGHAKQLLEKGHYEKFSKLSNLYYEIKNAEPKAISKLLKALQVSKTVEETCTLMMI